MAYLVPKPRQAPGLEGLREAGQTPEGPGGGERARQDWEAPDDPRPEPKGKTGRDFPLKGPERTRSFANFAPL